MLKPYTQFIIPKCQLLLLRLLLFGPKYLIHYQRSKTYVVNGTNVISGITAVDVSNSTSDGKVELYKVGTVAYVLSSYDI